MFLEVGENVLLTFTLSGIYLMLSFPRKIIDKKTKSLLHVLFSYLQQIFFAV